MTSFMTDMHVSPEVDAARKAELEALMGGETIGGKLEIIEEPKAIDGVDPDEWDKAMQAANTIMGLSGEQNWASWKCDGGPHGQGIESL